MAKEVTCSWCNQESSGPWKIVKLPRFGFYRFCPQCSFGWASLFAYSAGLLGAVNRRRL